MKKISKYTIIEWEDHYSDGAWKSKEELVQMTKNRMICTTVGEVTYEDKDIVILSASFDGEDKYGENMAIIKECIIKRTKI